VAKIQGIGDMKHNELLEKLQKVDATRLVSASKCLECSYELVKEVCSECSVEEYYTAVAFDSLPNLGSKK
jgi:hypothetical protein